MFGNKSPTSSSENVRLVSLAKTELDGSPQHTDPSSLLLILPTITNGGTFPQRVGVCWHLEGLQGVGGWQSDDGKSPRRCRAMFSKYAR
ncbi:hypothetical protein FKM82_029843 [Ascaphus truei]